jgi:hypothetical protein
MAAPNALFPHHVPVGNSPWIPFHSIQATLGSIQVSLTLLHHRIKRINNTRLKLRVDIAIYFLHRTE